MAVRTPRNTRESGRTKRPKAPPPSAPLAGTDPSTTDRAGPIPQKALVYAVRLTEPPAISDEVPDEVPFPTNEK